MRRPVTIENIDTALAQLREFIIKKADRKGWGTHHNIHETTGLVLEEWDEFIDEVHLNNQEGQRNELFDISVSTIWDIISLLNNHEAKGE